MPAKRHRFQSVSSSRCPRSKGEFLLWRRWWQLLGWAGGTARISDVRMQEAFDTGADKGGNILLILQPDADLSSSKHNEQRKVFDIAELVAEKLQ